MSLAREGAPSAASSGARKPGVPVRRRGASGADDRPKSTSLMRAPLVRIRFAGFTSPWMTGGSWEWKCVRASARLGEIRQHARRRQSWPATIAEQLRQVSPVDPVHRDHVAVSVEEVLANQRQCRVRRNAEQDACLTEKLLARAGVARRSNLQGDKALVLVVQRLDHARLAADPERFEELVAIPEQRGHRAHRVPTNLPLVSRRAQAAPKCP
jgi:hypothetical protein